MKATFTVRGIKVRSQSQRRYIVVQAYVPPEGFAEKFEPGVIKPRATIAKRSDSRQTAIQQAQRLAVGGGWTAHIIDTVTGEEIR